MKSGNRFAVDAFAAGFEHQVHAEAVGADAEKDGLPQAEDAGESPDERHAHGQDGQRQVFAEQVQVVVGDVPAGVQQRQANHQNDRQRGTGQQRFFPSRGVFHGRG